MEYVNNSVSTNAPEQSVPVPATPLTSAMVPSFLEYLRVEETRRPDTLVRYQSHLARFAAIAGDPHITEIDGEKITYFKRKLLDQGLGPATTGAIMSCLRSFLRYLRDVRRFQVYDPEKVRRPRVPKRQVEYLTKEEMKRFLEAIPTRSLSGLRDRALIEVLFATGMRISEALSLERTAIDWETRDARVIGKGNKERKIFFSEQSMEWLREYVRYRYDSHPALFVTHSEHPRPLKAQGTWRRFHRYAKLAGLTKKVYPHMLRHTMATTLLANGCPIGHIKVLLGHENLQTTCKYYLGVISDKEAKEAHDKFISLDEPENKTDGKETSQQKD